MRFKAYVAVVTFFGCIATGIAQHSVPTTTDDSHASATMTFVVKAPLQRAAPLFAPTGMQCWLGTHMQPEFVYAQKAKDTAGAVFTLQQGPQKSVWVNTMLDVKGGKMQYAMFLPEMVTVVDVKLSGEGKDATRIELTHTVTALSAASHDALKSMGSHGQEHTAAAEKAIEGCLASNGGVQQ